MNIFSYTHAGATQALDASTRDLTKLLERGRTPPPKGEPFGHRHTSYEERLGFAITLNLAWDLASIEERWKRSPYKPTRQLKYQAALGFPITPRLVQRLELREGIESRKA